jgi:hypothetical protein
MSFDRHRIEAELAVAMIPSRDMPKIAVDGLESGLDGPATRQLAGLEKPSPFEVAEILPKACKELGLSNLTVGQGLKDSPGSASQRFWTQTSTHFFL